MLGGGTPAWAFPEIRSKALTTCAEIRRFKFKDPFLHGHCVY